MSNELWKIMSNPGFSISAHEFDCGFCGCHVSSALGDFRAPQRSVGRQLGYYESNETVRIRVCPQCQLPTVFVLRGPQRGQHPGALPGKPVGHLPTGVSELYHEARVCLAAGAFTACAHVCRKLLMNTAAHEGATAAEASKFIKCIEFLERENVLGRKMKDWVDKIRKIGNSAAHDVKQVSEDDAKSTFVFTEILLRTVYEMPGSC